MSSIAEEKRAHALYKAILCDVVEPLIGDDTTYDSTLNAIGAQLLGKSYKGTHPADRIPDDMKEGQCAIINLDNHNQSGSHWVAVIRHNGELCIYDSFGRPADDILPSAETSGNGEVINADHDREQKDKEKNCGQRSIAWLCLAKHWTPDLALLV